MSAKILSVALCGLFVLFAAASAYGAPKKAGANIPLPAGVVGRIKVLADKAPDCSTRKSIIESVTRGCKTNDEKAIAVYNFCRLAYYHRAYPGEKGGIPALKMIHVYGWSLCGGQHTVLAALWRAAGWDWRYIGWRGHTTVECRYDEKWHYYDTFLKVYAWKPDSDAPGGRTVASQADILANPDLISKNFVYDEARRVWYVKDNQYELINGAANWQAPAFFVCGDKPKGVVNGVKTTRVGKTSVKFGHMGLKILEDGYTSAVNLGPGGSLTLLWDQIKGAHWYHWKSGRKYTPQHGCGDKEYRNCPAIGPVLEPYRKPDNPSKNPKDPLNRGARTFASGKLLFAPDLTNDAFLASLAAKDNVKVAGGKLVPADAAKPASITV
ncbi:hypothetical protein LCGC14_2277810, partial [marine sediment metagenome]